MKHQNNGIQRCGKKTKRITVSTMEITNNYRNGGKINKKQKNQLYQKYRKFHTSVSRNTGPYEFLFYAILNTEWSMDQGTAAAIIADGLMSLYSQLDADQQKWQYVDIWSSQGRKIVVLEAYEHKHLKYLEDEIKPLGIDTFAVRETWGRNKSIIMLAVFGLREELEEYFEGLSHLR